MGSMRIALFSDLHGNREALDATLAHAERRGADKFVFLGDMVGYGADPCYVVEKVAQFVERGAVALVGNHDEAALACSTDGMNDYARAALEWTVSMLGEAHRAFLASLPRAVVEEDRLYVHSEASAPEDWLYVSTAADAERSMRTTEQRLTFCGHVHRPQLFHMNLNRPASSFAPTTGMPVPLLRTRRWLMVLPSVGQPRDENPASGYGLLDTTQNEFTIWRTNYDVETAAQKIHAAGLPRILAARLYVGR
jgi:diadenosine tetraphosphatase ApaH/serine/threonine PP2A family protein phosphatase